jgi:hypothetical protein
VEDFAISPFAGIIRIRFHGYNLRHACHPTIAYKYLKEDVP